MKIKTTLLLTLLISILAAMPCISGTCPTDKAPAMPKIKKPPFLITSGLPHYTTILIRLWDNPELGLSKQQQRWLRVVGEETIQDVKKINRELQPLEQEVIRGINSGMTPDELAPKVDRIAQLKKQATMVHLKCIYDTRKILTDSQLGWLNAHIKKHMEKK